MYVDCPIYIFMDEAINLNVALWSCCNFISNDQIAEALLLD